MFHWNPDKPCTANRSLTKIAQLVYRLKTSRFWLNGRSMPGGKPKTSLKTTILRQTCANGQKQRWKLPEKVSQKHSIPIVYSAEQQRLSSTRIKTQLSVVSDSRRNFKKAVSMQTYCLFSGLNCALIPNLLAGSPTQEGVYWISLKLVCLF